MSQRNLLILLAVALISYVCYVRGEQDPYARYVAGGFAAIRHDALAQLPPSELFSGAMRGMVDVLREHGDQHSQFISAQEADPFRVEIRQQFGGIGVRLRFLGEPPRLTVAGPPNPGTPAARANLLPGDRIVEIDGHPTDDMSMADVLLLMRGEPSKPLQLTVEPTSGGPTRLLQLVREVITIDSVLGDRRDADGRWQFRLPSDPRIAHVRLTLFGDKTAEEFAGVLARLAEEHVEAVILDLRDDAGGSLEAAVAVCDMLLPGGLTIVETRGRDQTLRARYTTSGNGPFVDLPLAVLINQNTASASEIVAACLQDHGRAAIVGERTYGKGTVQELVTLESGRSLLKLTSASYWRPSGRNIDRLPDAAAEDNWGVSPDPSYEVKLTTSEYAEYRKYRNDRDMLSPTVQQKAAVAAPDAGPAGFVDRPLQKATQYLQSQLDREMPLASRNQAAL